MGVLVLWLILVTVAQDHVNAFNDNSTTGTVLTESPISPMGKYNPSDNSTDDMEATPTNITLVQPEDMVTTSSYAPMVKPAPRFESGMVIVPTFLALGLFGNFMTLTVINMKDFRHMTSSLILTALSLSDTMLIIMFPFNKKFFLMVLPVDPRSVSWLSCKVFYWFWRTAKMTSSWLVVLISMERFIAVSFPLRAKFINTRKNILLGIVLIYVCIGGFNIGWGVVADVMGGAVCMPNMPSAQSFIAAAKAFIIAGTLVYSIIPATIVFLLNLLTIAQLLIQRQRRMQMTSSASSGTNTDQTTKTTVMLMTVSTAFIILVIPISIAHCLALFLGVSIFTSTDPDMVILREVAQTLEQLNYSINFFLYVLSSEKFRKHVKIILCCMVCKKTNHTKPGSSSKESNLTSIKSSGENAVSE